MSEPIPAPPPEPPSTELRVQYVVTRIEDHGEGTGQNQYSTAPSSADEAIAFISSGATGS